MYIILLQNLLATAWIKISNLFLTERQIPDGPFNPTNYAGTQINVWGGNGQIPSYIPPSTIPPPYSTQMGYLTENMINVSNIDTYHHPPSLLPTLHRWVISQKT